MIKDGVNRVLWKRWESADDYRVGRLQLCRSVECRLTETATLLASIFEEAVYYRY